MPSTAAATAALLEKANSLPLCPGVYIMKDKNGKVIYVGKSRKLKNRVSQYFQNGGKNVKTSRMVAAAEDFAYILCDTEMEALTLENTLIKEHSPKYNIRLKDAKSYPYIKVTAGEYPAVVMTRRREGDRGRYFGPYSGVSTVFSVLSILQKSLGLPSCRRRFPEDIGKERPCLYYQMKQCCGVCTGKVSREEYAELIRLACEILRGDVRAAVQMTEAQMLAAAEEERYEMAAHYRDTAEALKRLSQKQKVVASPEEEADYYALRQDEMLSCLSALFVRGGAVNDKWEYEFGADTVTDSEALSRFLCDSYRARGYVPPHLYLDFTLEDEDRESAEACLSAMAGRKVSLVTPERGERKTLCAMAGENAEEYIRQARLRAVKEDGVLLKLAHLLCLETLPERIEAFDISNVGQEFITAGMVVYEGGKFKKSDYRVFRMKKVEGIDDYASMREAIARRLAHISDESGSFASYPDLLLIDGGKGHIGVVEEVLREKGIAIPAFGMVKDDFHKTRALCTADEEIGIAREREIFMLIYRIQEEVHRFTVSRMEGAKRKTLRHSSLTQIEGIGEKKAALLLKSFGTLAALRGASKEEIAAVKGVSAKDAEAVTAYFQKKKTEQET